MPVDLGSAYGHIDIGTDGAQQSVQSLSDSLKSTGKTMSLAISTPLTTMGTLAILSAADFEQSMNVMQQVSGATGAQMQALQDQALQLGAETSFSAGEAASAMLELAKAGMSVDEVTAAIGGTMDLAAAGGLDLALAAEITANAVNSFGLEASAAGDVANLLAAAANASSVEVSDLAAGMQMASAVFAASGQSIETLNTALALLGNNGMKGSDAGTSLKTMMMRLTAPTDEAAAVMESLGISVYDADGKMRALPDVLAEMQQALYGTNAVTVTSSNLTADQAARMEYLQSTISRAQTSIADYQSGVKGATLSEEQRAAKLNELNASLNAAQTEYAGLASVGGTTSTVMRTLTEEQRTQALTAMFGADAIRAVNILLNEGETGWNDMAAALGNETAAADVANARMKGFAGAMEYLKGSIDSFLIGTALPFLDSMSGMVRQGADLISMFGTLSTPVKNAGLAFAAVLAAAGPLMLALPAIGTAVGALLSPVGLVALAVGALAAAWVTDFGGIRTAVEPLVLAMVGWFQAQLPAAIAVVQAAWAALPGVLGQLQAGLMGVWAWIQPLIVQFQTMMPGAVVAMQGSLAGLPAMFGQVSAGLMGLWAGAQPIIMQLQAFFAPAVARLQTAFGSLGVQISAMAPQFGTLLTAVQGLWTAMQPILQGLATAVGVTLAVAMDLGINLLSAAFENATGLIGPLINQLIANINLISSTMREVVALISAIAAGDWSAAWASIQRIVGNFKTYFETTIANLSTFAKTIFTALGQALTTTMEDMGIDVQSALTSLKTAWEQIFNAFGEPVEAVIGSIQAFWDKVTALKDWLTGLTLPNPFAGITMPQMPAIPNLLGGNAEGATWHRGGLTWVGERGPELVRMPPGADVLTAGQSNRLRTSEGRIININLGGVTVNGEMDVHTLGYKLAGVLEGFGF